MTNLALLLRRFALPAGMAAAFVLAPAQETLTLPQALQLARERNGGIRAALLQVEAAEERVRQTQALFLPTVTPSLRYANERREFGGTGFDTDGLSTRISANWRLLDTGERTLTRRAQQRFLDAQEAIAYQTLRAVLFTVHQQYLDTLRAQELQRVADAQVRRADEILNQTRVRVELGDLPRKDVLQAEADALNARVLALVARNRTVANAALLRATIGLEEGPTVPELAEVPIPDEFPAPLPREVLVTEALENRPDLEARRLNIQGIRFQGQRAQREAGLTFAVDAGFDRQITPEGVQNRTVALIASYPLFDGGRLRAAARETQRTAEAQEADLLQAERQVRAEVESAQAEVSQNAERVEAAQLALNAARLNYQAVYDAYYTYGAADLIEVLTAQLSLVTAESNFIEAIYDYTISEVRLRLAVGMPIPGEALVPAGDVPVEPPSR